MDTNSIQQHQKELCQKLWAMANALRGNMEAYEFKNYILGMIFYYYLSDRTEKYMVNLLKDDGISYEKAWADQEYREAVVEESLRDLGFVIDNEPHMFTDGVHVAEDGTETSYNINEIKPTDESGYIDGMTVAVHYTGENSVGLTTTVQGKMLFDTSHALSTPRKIDLGANLKKVLDDSDVTEEDPYYTPIRNYLVANGVITEGGTEG